MIKNRIKERTTKNLPVYGGLGGSLSDRIIVHALDQSAAEWIQDQVIEELVRYPWRTGFWYHKVQKRERILQNNKSVDKVFVELYFHDMSGRRFCGRAPAELSKIKPQIEIFYFEVKIEC